MYLQTFAVKRKNMAPKGKGRPRGSGLGSCSNCNRIWLKTGKRPEHGETGKNAATCPWPKTGIPREFYDDDENSSDQDDGARPTKVAKSIKPEKIDTTVQTDDPTEYCPVCHETRLSVHVTKFYCGHFVCTECILSMSIRESHRASILSIDGIEIANHQLSCPLCRTRGFSFLNGFYHQNREPNHPG